MMCRNYDTCVDHVKSKLLRPVDSLSLYNNQIYDSETARRVCYNKEPIEIIEGNIGFFDQFNNKTLFIAIVMILFFIYYLKNKQF